MKTKQQVIDWLESKVGTTVTCKGDSSLDGQCVTLIKALMEFIGVPDPYKARGHAKNCINAYLSEGIADKGTGFLSVFSNKNMGGGYGHIWCLPTDVTEVLTPSGFVKLTELKKGDEVFGYDNGEIIKDKVLSIVKPRQEKVIKVRQTEATAEHRFLTITSNTKNYSVKRWDKVFNGSVNYFPHSLFNCDDGLPLADEEIALLVATQADGSYMKQGGVEFHFKKQRKIERLCSLLDSLGIDYSHKKHITGTKIRIYGSGIVNFLEKYLDNKNFSNEFLKMNSMQRDFFLKEILKWDGYKREVNYNYTSVKKENIDIVQSLLFLDGKTSLIQKNNVSLEWGDRGQYTISKNMESNERITEISCISTNSTFFIMRQYGRVQIVGNCNAGDGDGTYYEQNGQKALTVTKGKTYTYDNVCNFDKYISEGSDSGMQEELNKCRTDRDDHWNDLTTIKEALGLPGDSSIETTLKSLAGTKGLVGTLQRQVSELEQEVKNQKEKVSNIVSQYEQLLLLRDTEIARLNKEAKAQKDKTDQMEGMITTLQSSLREEQKQHGLTKKELSSCQAGQGYTRLFWNIYVKT